MTGPERIAEKIVGPDTGNKTLRQFNRVRDIIAAEVAPMVDALKNANWLLSEIIESGELKKVYAKDNAILRQAVAALTKWEKEK